MVADRITKTRTASAVALALVLAAAASVRGAAAQPTQELLLLVGARILDARAGRYLAPATVVISGDRIQSIGGPMPANLPAGAQRIDLSGTTLVPGLGDMFASASPDGSADADFYYAMALAHGVTQYRVMGARLPWAKAQRERSARGEVLAPRLAIAGPQLEQHPAVSPSERFVADAQAARREVALQARSGAEWIAVGPSTSLDLYKAILPAARAAKLKVSAQPGIATMGDLLRTGVDAIDRVGFFSRSVEDATIDDLWQSPGAADVRPAQVRGARRGQTLIPMLASFNGTLRAAELERDPALPVLPARWREALVARAHPANWSRAAAADAAADTRGRMVRALAAAGVRVATGVDVDSSGYNVPGAGIHRELSLLVKAGLSPAEAIRAATVNCAELVGSTATLGQIKTGFKADLFAVEGDPLANVEDLRRIRLVVRGGEALNPAELLAQAKRAAR